MVYAFVLSYYTFRNVSWYRQKKYIISLRSLSSSYADAFSFSFSYRTMYNIVYIIDSNNKTKEEDEEKQRWWLNDISSRQYQWYFLSPINTIKGNLCCYQGILCIISFLSNEVRIQSMIKNDWHIRCALTNEIFTIFSSRTKIHVRCQISSFLFLYQNLILWLIKFDIYQYIFTCTFLVDGHLSLLLIYYHRQLKRKRRQ
jgi:hypothetical protein